MLTRDTCLVDTFFQLRRAPGLDFHVSIMYQLKVLPCRSLIVHKTDVSDAPSQAAIVWPQEIVSAEPPLLICSDKPIVSQKASGLSFGSVPL